MWAILGVSAAAAAGYYVLRDKDRRISVLSTIFDPLIKYGGELKRRFNPDDTSQQVKNRSNDNFQILDAKILLFHSPLISEQPKIEQIPSKDAPYLIDYSWSKLSRSYLRDLYGQSCYHTVLLHVIYSYEDELYRLVLDRHRDQSPSVLTDFSWTTGTLKFHQELEEVRLNGKTVDDQVANALKQYSGPLGDYYDELPLNQNKRGFLDYNAEKLLFNNDRDIYEVETVLGDIRELKID